ncbi:hypothetical protein ACQI4F_24855 [Mycolicibacterium vaccae]|uniref:hypothetical protein n=1 Tax=Mycolicibacterium vaccae TaxID=1810 RepID=UPI003CE734C5
MTPATPAGRPRLVDVSFWCFIAGAVLLILGGLMASSATFEAARAALPDTIDDDSVRNYLTIYRSTGIGAVIVGGVVAFLAGRARRGDARFRLALLGLVAAITVVMLLMALGFKVAHPVILLAVLPLLAGAALFTRPAAAEWYDPERQR